MLHIGDIVEAIVTRVVGFGVILRADDEEIVLMGVDAGVERERVAEAYPVGSKVRVRVTHRSSADSQCRAQLVPQGSA